MTVRAMKAGAVEFLTKPFRDQDLLDAVQLALERDVVLRQVLLHRSEVGRHDDHLDAFVMRQINGKTVTQNITYTIDPVDEEELYPPVAEHLPEYEYDHEVDGGAEEELPPHEPRPPVKPGKPGEPVPRPCIPVVRAVELEPGEEVPAAQPSQPGCLCIVYVDQASPKALAWLQGESDLPMAMHETEAHPPTTPTPQPGTPVQPHPEREFHGHWVRVETTPSEPDHDGQVRAAALLLGRGLDLAHWTSVATARFSTGTRLIPSSTFTTCS